MTDDERKQTTSDANTAEPKKEVTSEFLKNVQPVTKSEVQEILKNDYKKIIYNEGKDFLMKALRAGKIDIESSQIIAKELLVILRDNDGEGLSRALHELVARHPSTKTYVQICEEPTKKELDIKVAQLAEDLLNKGDLAGAYDVAHRCAEFFKDHPDSRIEDFDMTVQHLPEDKVAEEKEKPESREELSRELTKGLRAEETVSTKANKAVADITNTASIPPDTSSTPSK